MGDVVLPWTLTTRNVAARRDLQRQQSDTISLMKSAVERLLQKVLALSQRIDYICSMKTNAKSYALSELAIISAGHPVRGSVDDLPAGDVVMLQMRDVDMEAGIQWDSAARIQPPGKRSPDYLADGDVIFTSRGARNLSLPITNPPGPAICAPNFFVIRVREPSTCLPKYLAWFMNQSPVQNYLQREATGSSILNIRREVVERIAIPVPSLSQQSAIVKMDDESRKERKILRELIDNRNQQMEALAFGLAGCMEA